MKSAYKNTYLIGNAALYTEATIQALFSANQLLITRVPQKIKNTKQFISKAKQVDWVSLNDGYSGYWSHSEYDNVPQRWLLVKSNMTKNREVHILNEKILNRKNNP